MLGQMCLDNFFIISASVFIYILIVNAVLNNPEYDYNVFWSVETIIRPDISGKTNTV